MYQATAFTFRCETAYGSYSYATASLDNDTAFEYYQNVIRNDPSEFSLSKLTFGQYSHFLLQKEVISTSIWLNSGDKKNDLAK